MLVEILFLTLVLLVVLLVAVDVSKEPSEIAQVQADRRPHETERATIGAPGDSGAVALPWEPADTGKTAPAHDAWPAAA